MTLEDLKKWNFNFFITIYYDFLGETIMAKRKDLLLTESITSRMMGLAGLGSLNSRS